MIGCGVIFPQSEIPPQNSTPGGGALLYWVESESTNAGKTATKWTPISVNTNQSVVIQPKGNGAVIVQQPDNATTGGNNRGVRSIDLQLIRDNADQVASGIESVVLGSYNKSDSNYAVAIGYKNVSSSISSHAYGTTNTVTGQRAIAVGFNNIVSGINSYAVGRGNEVLVDESGAFGNVNTLSNIEGGCWAFGTGNDVSGEDGTAMGRGLVSRAKGETAVGLYNADYTAALPDGYDMGDRVFSVGNGSGTGVSRSSALTIFRNGIIEFNEAYKFPIADGTVGQALVTDGSGNLSFTTVGGGGGGLTYWTESEGTYLTKTFTKFTPISANTNQSVILQPKGEGGLIANQPDGTATGGDNRARNTVDWQTVRANADQVASGIFSVIGGGTYNKANGYNSTIAGGQANVASEQYTSILGGRNNTASGLFSTVLGGEFNVSAGKYSLSSGIYTNAPSFGETTFGLYPTTYSASSATAVIGSDRIFTIGNGTGTGTRSDAFIILKNGNGIIQGNFKIGAYTLPAVDGTVGQVPVTNGAGVVSWGTVGGGGGATTLTNVGTGSQIAKAIAGSNYPIRTLTAGAGVTVVQGTDDIVISATPTASTTLTNVGTGSQIVKPISGSNYPHRTLKAGTGVTVVQGTDDIVISATAGGLTYFAEDTFTEGTVNYSRFKPVGGANRGISLEVLGTGNVDIGSYTNTVEGSSNIAIGSSNVLGSSGTSNIVISGGSSISNGQNNVILGGSNHTFTTSGNFNASLGGQDNDIAGTVHHSILLGGHQNGLTDDSNYSIIGSGFDNAIYGSEYSGIFGGNHNEINLNANYSFILAGKDSIITAGAIGSVAIGQDATNDGNYSSTFGRGLLSKSYGEHVVGIYNTSYTANSKTAHNVADKIFTVGNGTSDIARSNALAVYKSGAVEINEEYTLPTVDSFAGSVVTSNGSGVATFELMDSLKIRVTSNGAYAANRFISPDNDYTYTGEYGYAVTTEAVATATSTTVIVSGIAYIKLSGTVYAGDDIVADTDGEGMPNPSSLPASAIALEDGVAGDTIKVKLK